MDLLIILCYVAIAWGVFKIFRIPVNKWTIPTAILGGIVVVGALILTMNYNHPYTLRAQKIVVSIPMVPQVSGEVVEVTSKTNVLMKKGELLFRIDDTRYRARLNKLKADLAGRRRCGRSRRLSTMPAPECSRRRPSTIVLPVTTSVMPRERPCRSILSRNRM